KNTWLTIVWICLASAGLFGQSFVQTLRGTIRDSETLTPVYAAQVMVYRVLDDSLVASISTNAAGQYTISDLEVGRIRISVQAAGYAPVVREDILLTAERTQQIDLEMEVSGVTLESIEVNATTLRGEPLNPWATSSALTITPEQTQKFAGSWDDPMRVITAFPGVVQQGSRYNNFTIRGNSPVGMLYRLEGVPIHNPNHFAVIGSTGGFVTQFSSAVLSSSDFFSSAFPAEFGNATSAAFDFRFRKGNPEKRQHTFNASVFGLDFATEGPFSKNHKASYLVNYRYSTLGLLALMVDLGGVRPGYQDLSFNVNVPTRSGGSVKVFGVGGLSNFTLEAETDSSNWGELSDRVERRSASNSGAMGVALYEPVSENGYVHAVAAVSAGKYFDNQDYLEDDLSWSTRSISEYDDTRLTFTADYNHRFGPRHVNKSGVIFTHNHHRYTGALFSNLVSGLDTTGFTSGAAQHVQVFSQSKFLLTDKLHLNVGVHVLHFLLNNRQSIDPRLGLTYQPSLRSKIALSYGHHSRIENLAFYFLQNESGTFINRNLGLFKSHHGVLSYTTMLTKSLKLKAEGYFQYMYDVPADAGSYSVQNLFTELPIGNLRNVGQGTNYGLELLLHRFSRKGFYYMLSGAIFDSRYAGGDGIWRNSEFNQRFSYNVLVGKEVKLKPKPKKKRLLGFNLNFRHSGGTWYNPVDLQSSLDYGWTRFDFSDRYTRQNPQLYNLDFTFTRRVIRKKVSGEFTLSIKNIVNNEAVLTRYFDPDTETVRERTDYGRIPVLGYKVSF
ncbi:MAG: carboxypeptidase-like regulatory domain-containing protein, partial [Bacteroidota bacterium]